MKPIWRFAMVCFTEIIIGGITCYIVYSLVQGNGILSEAERLQFFGLIGAGLYGMLKCLDSLIDKDIK